MPEDVMTTPESQLTLDSRIEQLQQLWPWADALATEHSVPASTLYAIHLCLEEAVSNIIRHGYREEPGQPITIEFAAEPQKLKIRIEDRAPAFDPLRERAAEPIPSRVEDLPLGGRGIRLIQKYADSLAYERLADGNRLCIGFKLPG